MAVDNPLLPEANRAAGLDTPWDGDDQQWWDWYVTLADNGPAGELVDGPGPVDAEPASEEEVRAALEEPYALPDDAVERFAEDAFVKLPGVLPTAVVAALAARLQRLLVTAHGPDTAGRFLALEQMWLTDPLMALIALSPRLGGVAAALLDTPAVRLYHDNALSKESGCGRTPWHHDAEHFPFTPATAVTAWMPMTAIPRDMGPLTFARGAHLPEVLADLEFDKTGTSYDVAVAARLRTRGEEVVSTPYAAGEVSFHSSRCFHTAGPNRTRQPRRALATTYLPDGVRIVDQPTMISGTWQAFVPDTRPGELVASPLNPVVGRR